MPTWSQTTNEKGRWTSTSWYPGTIERIGGSDVGGARFTNVQVPAGHTVSSATLTLTGVSYNPSPSAFTAGVFATADMPPLAAGQRDNATVGTASVSSPGATVAWDVKDLIVAWRGLSGWTPGNDVGVRLATTYGFTTSGVSTITLEIEHVDPYDAGDDQVVEPWELVTLTGTPSGGTWTQVSGTPVTLAGSGAVRTFTAPASLSQQVLTFAYGTDEMTVTVNPAKASIKRPSGLVPARFQIVP